MSFNGNLVTHALIKLGRKAPMGVLVATVAELVQIPVNHIKDTVIEIVAEGERLGFFQRTGNVIHYANIPQMLKIRNRAISEGTSKKITNTVRVARRPKVKKKCAKRKPKSRQLGRRKKLPKSKSKSKPQRKPKK